MKKIISIFSLVILVALFSSCSSFGLSDGLAIGENENQYEYQKLNETEQHAYRILLEDIPKHVMQIHLPNLSEDDLLEVFTAVLYDNPEIMYIGNSFGWGEYGFGSYIEPEYFCSIQECQQKQNEIDEKVEEILTLVDEDMTDFEKEVVLHDYLALNCVYSEAEEGYTMYDALILEECVCEGYAEAFMYLLDKVGVKSHVVVGTIYDDNDENVSHMWNAVEIDGEYYHVDPTWNSTYINYDIVDHTYFNLTDEEISVYHSDFEKLNNTKTNNYYMQKGFYVQSIDEVDQVIKKQFEESSYVEIQVEKDIFDDTMKYLFDEDNISTILNDTDYQDVESIYYLTEDEYGVIMIMI